MRRETEALRASRPHVVRGVLFLLVTIAGAVTADLAGQLRDIPPRHGGDPATTTEQLVTIVGAVVVLVAGVLSVRSFAKAVRRAAEVQGAQARGGTLSFVVSVTGYALVLLATLGVLGVPLGGLLLGGAVTGVVVGIAAQQTIGNFFAGVVLMVVRPFTIGELVVLRSGALGGEYIGTVTDMTLFYVHMVTETGPVVLPNSGVLAAAIGPGARAQKDEEREAEDEPAPEEGGPPR